MIRVRRRPAHLVHATFSARKPSSLQCISTVTPLSRHAVTTLVKRPIRSRGPTRAARRSGAGTVTRQGGVSVTVCRRDRSQHAGGATDNYTHNSTVWRSQLRLREVHARDYRSINDSGPFEVEPGKTVLVGVNGAGKTALLRALEQICLLYTSPSPRDRTRSRMPSSA